MYHFGRVDPSEDRARLGSAVSEYVTLVEAKAGEACMEFDSLTRYAPSAEILALDVAAFVSTNVKHAVNYEKFSKSSKLSKGESSWTCGLVVMDALFSRIRSRFV